MSSAAFTKSSTNGASLPGNVRFRRESVWTACTQSSRLSTYIAHNSGWSKPVWYLFATGTIGQSAEPKRPPGNGRAVHRDQNKRLHGRAERTGSV